jgi:hypothetical protein
MVDVQDKQFTETTFDKEIGNFKKNDFDRGLISGYSVAKRDALQIQMYVNKYGMCGVLTLLLALAKANHRRFIAKVLKRAINEIKGQN